MTIVRDDLEPVILLGGTGNALSVARSLGRRGIDVYTLNQPKEHVQRSRFAKAVDLPAGRGVQEAWLEWLLGPDSRELSGAVVMPCNDDGLELIARHRGELEERYQLTEAADDSVLAMLDKARTYEIALQTGVPAPAVHPVETEAQLEELLPTLTYPCGLKPRDSHHFAKHFGTKLFLAHTPDELRDAFATTAALELRMLVTEIIPGGDDQFVSYYTYLDETGSPMFHMTKRKLRQYPYGFGTGTYHLTDWNPEVAEAGARFLSGSGLRGIAHVEFKRDPRDGELKLIECNARFTLVNDILMIAGLDLPLFTYNRITGRPLPPMDDYRRDVRMLRLHNDFLAFRIAHNRGELTWSRWLRSLAHRQHFLYFSWTDPEPSLYHWYRITGHYLKKSASSAGNRVRAMAARGRRSQ